MVGWVGGAAGEMENKAISASNLKLKLTEAELGKNNIKIINNDNNNKNMLNIKLADVIYECV